jgi:signal transduction histidine kinase/CheY-like chemotaxis protein
MKHQTDIDLPLKRVFPTFRIYFILVISLCILLLGAVFSGFGMYISALVTASLLALILLISLFHFVRITLKHPNDLLTGLMNAVSDAVLIVTIHKGSGPGRIIRANDSACRMLGYSRAELYQMSYPDISDSAGCQDGWERCIRAGNPFNQVRTPRNGGMIAVETWSCPVQYRGTEAVMLVDHVIEKPVSVDGSKDRDQKGITDRAKSAFLANMSHEIRTPMNAILGFTQLLRRDRTLPIETREHLDIIHRSGEHLLALINDVLELSKIEAGRVVLNNEQFDMPRLVSDLQHMFHLRIKQKGLCFSVESESDFAGKITADKGKVRQILINMLSNAVKFTDKGGIIVRYGNTSTDSGPGDIRIWVEIEDTGRGIAEENLEKVFLPFEQVLSENPETGTGLGMTISREYARLMDGDITVNSRLKKGTTFRLEFGAASVPDLSTEDTQHTTILKLILKNEYKILVADDRTHNRQLLQALLTRNGFQVETTADGPETLEKFTTYSPHLVLMDLTMASMNSSETAAGIRALPNGKTVPICLLSAGFMDSVHTPENKDLFTAIIRKPFKDMELLAVIRDALNLDYTYEYEPKLSGSIFSTKQMQVSSHVLPPENRAALSRAVRSGDMDRFEELTEKLSLDHPLIAARLKQFADNYDYDKLLFILEDPETET